MMPKTQAEKQLPLFVRGPCANQPRVLLPGELDALIQRLTELDSFANYPVKLVENYEGDNWLLGWGETLDGQSIYVTTDHVRASEMRGGAREDAECFVFLRNALPSIILELRHLYFMLLAKENGQDSD